MISIPVKDSGKPVKPLGVVWYDTEAVFEEFRALCPDFTQETYEVWKEAAQEALEEEGTPRVAVSVTSAGFKNFCKDYKLPFDAKARQRYVYVMVEVAYNAAVKERRRAKKK